MSILRVAVAAVGVAATLAQHPAVRAAAPQLISPKMKERAAEAALETAYRAGTVARRLVRRH